MNSVRSNNLSLKYQRVTTSSSKDIEVLIFVFVPKTQFLLQINESLLIEICLETCLNKYFARGLNFKLKMKKMCVLKELFMFIS